MDNAITQLKLLPDAKDPENLRVVQASETLRQKTLVKLREAIVSGYFKPNHRLVERDVCAQTGVSRSSVREALRYLESEGLVESRGTKGMFVVKLTIKEAMQIYELRMAVESAAAVQFTARATDAEIQELVDTFAAVKVAAVSDSEEYWRLTDRLFDIMMRGARNNVAYGLMTTLRTRIRYLRATTTRLATPEYRQESVQAMGALTDALALRDGPAAIEILRSFISRSAKFAIECLKIRDLDLEQKEAAG
jgi:DNA-binding GntR family transcriptional regulator